MELYNVIVPT